MSQEEVFSLDQFEVLKSVGCGQFGEVFQVQDKRTNQIYAAKVSLIPLKDSSKDAIHNLEREVNIISKIDHPGILKFIGFSAKDFHDQYKPVIVTEFINNGSLENLIYLENHNMSDPKYDDTHKLIILYGIASAMEYLHHHKIIHRDLKPDNILMDEYLFPKIADFGLSKTTDTNNQSLQSSAAVKGTPIFIAPEIFTDTQYTDKGDVYAYAMICYEIMTSEKPFSNFKNIPVFSLQNKICKGIRPDLNHQIPDSYKELIEKCWSQNPDDRPTFSEIVELLKNDQGFITPLVDEEIYNNYIEYIDQYNPSFDSNRKKISIDDLMKNKSKQFTKFSIDKTIIDDENNNQEEENIKRIVSLSLTSSSRLKVFKNKHDDFPQDQFEKLSIESQKIVNEAEDDKDKQFIVGKSNIEGINGFPQNTEIGVNYLKKSIANGCLESTIYYSQMLIKGQNVPSDVKKAKKLLEKHLTSKNSTILLLYGKALKKENNFEEASKYFLKAAKSGNGEAMYEQGKLLYYGQGCEKNENEAMKFFELAKKNKCDKSEIFYEKQTEKISLSLSQQFSLILKNQNNDDEKQSNNSDKNENESDDAVQKMLLNDDENQADNSDKDENESDKIIQKILADKDNEKQTNNSDDNEKQTINSNDNNENKTNISDKNKNKEISQGLLIEEVDDDIEEEEFGDDDVEEEEVGDEDEEQNIKNSNIDSSHKNEQQEVKSNLRRGNSFYKRQNIHKKSHNNDQLRKTLPPGFQMPQFPAQFGINDPQPPSSFCGPQSSFGFAPPQQQYPGSVFPAQYGQAGFPYQNMCQIQDLNLCQMQNQNMIQMQGPNMCQIQGQNVYPVQGGFQPQGGYPVQNGFPYQNMYQMQDQNMCQMQNQNVYPVQGGFQPQVGFPVQPGFQCQNAYQNMYQMQGQNGYPIQGGFQPQGGYPPQGFVNNGNFPQP